MGGMIQPWCQAHWDELRQAIEARGLRPWVNTDGSGAARQAERELAGTADDTRGYDPLLRAWSMIGQRVLESGGSLWACPLCEVQLHHDTCTQPGCARGLPAEWIAGCTDSLLDHFRELGLLPGRAA